MSHALFIHALPGMRRGGLFGFVALLHALLLVSLSSLATTPAQPDGVLIMAQMLPMGSGVPDAPPGPLPPSPEPEPESRVKPAPTPTPLPARKPRPASRKPVPSLKPAEPLPRAVTEASAFAPSASVSEAESAAPSAPDGMSTGGPDGASGGAPSGHTAPGGRGGGRGGGGIESLARFDANYLRNPAPPYPSMSRRLREQGKVFLRVRVTPEGAAGELEIKTSSGSARLDESALRTVRHWRFIPARRGGAAVSSWVVVPIIFKLE